MGNELKRNQENDFLKIMKYALMAKNAKTFLGCSRRVVKDRHRLSREAVESLSSEIFKAGRVCEQPAPADCALS